VRIKTDQEKNLPEKALIFSAKAMNLCMDDYLK